MKENRTRKTGRLLTWGSIIMVLLLGLIYYGFTQESIISKSIQHTVKRMDLEMQELISKGLNKAEMEKTQTGLVIFMSDTLVYWNRNDVNPKLMKRKVTLGNDTICSLLCGNYYIKSYQTGSMDYYVFRLLNTTYPINNKYLEDQCPIVPKFIQTNLSFNSNEEGFYIVNAGGKTLTKCQINSQAKIAKQYFYIFLIPASLLALGLILSLKRKRGNKQKKSQPRLEIGILVIILTSIIATWLYDRTTTKKENDNIKKTAESLLKKRDEAFETSYAAFLTKMANDSIFNEMLFSESNVLSDVILGYSKELLFDETMQDYSAALTLCAPEEEITIQPEGYVTNCDNYFLEKLANNKQKRVGDGLYFIDYYTLDPNYLGKYKAISKDSLQQKTLYFEFYKPIAPEGFALPQLLQENKAQNPHDYSVANYRDNQLVYKYGRYVYPNFISGLEIKDKEFTYSKVYKHYAICDNQENNVLLVSTPRKGWSESTAPFAVFFLGLMLPYLIIVWIIRPKEQHKWRDRSFRRRMQTLIFISLGVSFLVIGPVSVIYMQSLYNEKTTDSQFETTRTVSLEMQNDLDFATLLRVASRDDWNDILQHYANTFFTDLNLYHLNGQLLSTTRPEITEMNLQAPLMNAEAFQQMYRNKALYFTHKENLGKGVYESAYIPVTDDNGNTLAYLNTPYFSSTTDLHNEIKNFVLTYINIILIILGVALFLILRITNRLTQPLTLIQNKLGDIKIDQPNEPIEWNRDDEIGALVKQYNQLIKELEKSAAELKRTTTETAWRGVARQVAHEIKNSLTPMRLSVQLLQRNIDNGKATPEQIQRTTNTLIEQIDALSDIASSFSRYAKLPENNPQPLDLAELIQNIVSLYDNAENIVFHLKYDPEKDYTYNGDKTNLNSAITNLVKNATQAIGSKPDGKIEVTLTDTGTAFLISVKDNGKGIKDEDKDRIFLPNFTTKSGGSGVGLSLTYNIVQAAGGTITFESQEGKGAEFIIELPKK